MATPTTSETETETEREPGSTGFLNEVRSLSLAALLESLLFVADAPASISQLASVLGVSPAQVEMALAELNGALSERGIRLQRNGARVQLVTAPEAASVVERFLGLESQSRLSPAALETLAIIAYKQPVTRVEIEAIRGVNCDGVLRSLLSKGLIEEVGRLERAGRPVLYGTTFEFMQRFGLSSLSELPPLNQADERSGESLRD